MPDAIGTNPPMPVPESKIQHTPGPITDHSNEEQYETSICGGIKVVYSRNKEQMETEAKGNLSLLLRADYAPHDCDVPNCPGPKNLARLQAAEKLAAITAAIHNSLSECPACGAWLSEGETEHHTIISEGTPCACPFGEQMKALAQWREANS